MNNLLNKLQLTKYTYASPFDFSKHACIGCGGKAPLAIYPRSQQQTVDAVEMLQRQNVPFITVGNLSNVLPADDEISRVILCMKGLKETQENGSFLYVGAGMTSGELIKLCKERRLSGLEFLTGIPCTLGGALYMNAGVNGAHIEDVVDSVCVLRQGKVCEVKRCDCGYAYKTSVFMQNCDVILGATLRLEKATLVRIEERLAYYKEKRAHLPKGKSMGCVFKNSNGKIAGQLIEGAGLKGMRLGGAIVSQTHANFILNDNHATSSEIKRLINVVKNAVYAQYKIRLEEEIRYID